MVMLKSEKDKVRALLVEAIGVLCKNGLSYEAELSVEGLIGITLDKEDVFLVHINEKVCTASDKDSSDHENSRSPSKRSKTGRRRGSAKKRTASERTNEDIASSEEDNNFTTNSGEPAHKVMVQGAGITIKQEHGSMNACDDEDDIVILKSDPAESERDGDRVYPVGLPTSNIAADQSGLFSEPGCSSWDDSQPPTFSHIVQSNLNQDEENPNSSMEAWGEIIQQGRGYNMLSHGYIYKKDRPHLGYQYWRCVEAKCPGRAKSTMDDPPKILFSKKHSHFPDEADMCRRKYKFLMISKAKENPHVPLSKVYQEFCSEMQQSGADMALLPTVDSCRSQIHRIRRSTGADMSLVPLHNRTLRLSSAAELPCATPHNETMLKSDMSSTTATETSHKIVTQHDIRNSTAAESSHVNPHTSNEIDFKPDEKNSIVTDLLNANPHNEIEYKPDIKHLDCQM